MPLIQTRLNMLCSLSEFCVETDVKPHSSTSLFKNKKQKQKALMFHLLVED